MLIAGAMAAGTGWWYGGGPGGTATLKSVSGMTRESATAALKAQGFRIGAASTVWSTEDAGTVTATDPMPGSALHQGDPVTLTVSKGMKPAVVPTVKGTAVAAASAAVKAAGLTLAGTIPKASTRAVGTVLRLIGANGSTVPTDTSLPAGTPVRLVVSSGEPTPTMAPTPTDTATRSTY